MRWYFVLKFFNACNGIELDLPSKPINICSFRTKTKCIDRFSLQLTRPHLPAYRYLHRDNFNILSFFRAYCIAERWDNWRGQTKPILDTTPLHSWHGILYRPVCGIWLNLPAFMLNFKSKAIWCLLLWAFWYLNFILKPMCRSLKRSTYTAVKILAELCSQLQQAINV